MYVEALAKIDTPEAARALAIASISDPVEEVRLTCLDHLQTKKRPEVVAYFVGKLKDKKTTRWSIWRALALGRMKDPSAIGPLIDALVTVHKFKIVKPGGDNATTGTFGTGPGGRARRRRRHVGRRRTNDHPPASPTRPCSTPWSP